MTKTLIIFAHPYFEHSTTNIELIKVYKDNPNIDFRDLYEDYPDFHIQAFRERKRIDKYDHIIFHYPLIWFGMPPLLKLWIDEVMDLKWQNKDKDNPMAGKKASIIVSAGANEDSFTRHGLYKTLLPELTLGLKLSIETNDMTLENEMYIYQADDLSISEIVPFQNQLIKILKN